jgi:hypothetical protein
MAEQQNLIREWRYDPRRFAFECLRVGNRPDFKQFSAQQERGLEEYRKLVTAKIRKFAGHKLTEEEARYAGKTGLSIRSGTGTGKDMLAAIITLHFLTCFHSPKIPCIAPTKAQLKDVLWSEIHKWLTGVPSVPDSIPLINLPGQEIFEIQDQRVILKEKKGKEHFAVARTATVKASPEAQAQTLQGYHADNMLIIADEASGVSEAVFDPIMGTLTGAECNLMLVIFNPIHRMGFAADSQTKDRENWVCLHWNSEESENVSSDQIERMARKYGKESNAYRTRVLGEFPIDDPDVLIPWNWVMDAVDRDFKVGANEPYFLCVDVGAGGDESIILHIQGGRVVKIEEYNTKDTMELTGHVVRAMEECEADAIYVDVIGLGNGVYNRLREFRYKVYSVDVRRTARNERKFRKVRDELWWKLREDFENGTISIPNDDRLINELSIIKYEPTESDGKIVIESKKSLRKRLPNGASPNRADALMLYKYANVSIFQNKLLEDAYDREEAVWDAAGKTQDYLTWMTA